MTSKILRFTEKTVIDETIQEFKNTSLEQRWRNYHKYRTPRFAHTSV